jgi:hypothetical protein
LKSQGKSTFNFVATNYFPDATSTSIDTVVPSVYIDLRLAQSQTNRSENGSKRYLHLFLVLAETLHDV